MKKTNLWKRFVIVGSLASLSVVCVFAWFYMGNIAGSKPLDEQVVDAGYIKISGDDGNSWENGLDIDLGTVGVVREMSGNGIDLYEPVYGMYDIDGYKLVDDGEYYIEKSFVFETDIPGEIYLTNESYLIPSDTSGNFSNKGDFSRDYIAGAVRVAFFDVAEDGAITPLYIWAPNPTIEFTGNSVNEVGYVEESYFYQIGENVGDTVQIPTDNKSNGVSDDGSFVWGSPEQDGVRPLLVLETSENKPVRKTLMVRVWLEGTDRECVEELHNGKFSMYFKFDALGKEQTQ